MICYFSYTWQRNALFLTVCSCDLSNDIYYQYALWGRREMLGVSPECEWDIIPVNMQQLTSTKVTVAKF